MNINVTDIEVRIRGSGLDLKFEDAELTRHADLAPQSTRQALLENAKLCVDAALNALKLELRDAA